MTTSATGTGATSDDRRERGIESTVGQHGGVDTTGQVPQLGQRCLCLFVSLVHELTCTLRLGIESLPRPSEVHGQRHQALLGAIVEVTLDPMTLRLRAADRRTAAELQLVDPSS